jgi:hypothetical protein
MKNQSLEKLKAELKEQSELFVSCIVTRIENASTDDETRKINLENPYTLDIVLNEPDQLMDHAYDLGQFEAIQNMIANIDYELSYE